jgi:hypothetical protein
MKSRILTLLGIAILVSATAGAYPIDGYDDTGIRRLEAYRLINLGEIEGTKPANGALLPTSAVDLRLTGHKNLEIPPSDPEFTRQIRQLLGENADSYGIAVLDLSDPDNPRYAEHRGDYRQNVGSVGKIIAALGLFQALADTWADVATRERVLRQTIVTADEFSQRDHHKVPFFDLDTRKLVKRSIEIGDQATLWEYLDWMLSPSSNAAAGMVMREAMLLRQYGKDYAPDETEIRRFFDETPKSELTTLYARTFDEPLTKHGLDLDQVRQGSIFTRGGKNAVPGTGTSYATARTLMDLALLMEQGELVDEWSSRQLKRLLYLTERRIRYASSPQLRDAAVYFKSGSLYSCREEEGFECRPYAGNNKNFMSSFAIVESPAGDRDLDYMVMLISNVLRVNSAVEHQTLGTRIQQLLEGVHSQGGE